MPRAMVGPFASPSAVPMATPATSPIAQPVRQCSVALTAMLLTSMWCAAWSCTSTNGARRGAQSAEDTGLLGVKLRVGEDTLRLELPQRLELLDAALAVGGRRSRGGRCLLLGVRRRLLSRPAFRLATADAIRYGGGGARHNRDAGHPAKQTWHERSFRS